MRWSHFCEHEPGHPGTTSRSGAPFMGWRGPPFWAKATSTLPVIALAIGTPREMGSLPGFPDRWASAPTCAV